MLAEPNHRRARHALPDLEPHARYRYTHTHTTCSRGRPTRRTASASARCTPRSWRAAGRARVVVARRPVLPLSGAHVPRPWLGSWGGRIRRQPTPGAEVSELSIIISSALQAAARARVRQFRLFVVKRRPIRTRHVLSPRGGRPRSLHPRAAAARDRDLGGLKTPSPHMRHAPRLDGATLSRGGGGGAAPFRRPPDPSAADDHRLLSARRAAAVSERRRRTSRGRRLGRAFVVPTAGPRVVVVACHRVFFFGRRGFGRPAGALPGALPRSPARARRRERTSRGCSTHATEWHSDSWLPTETIVGSAALTFSIQFMKPRARGARRAARGARDKRGGRDEQSDVRRASRQHTHRASDERSKERDARRDDRSRDPIREVRLRRRDDGLERNRARRPSPLSKTPPPVLCSSRRGALVRSYRRMCPRTCRPRT